ncbi:MAG: NADH-quinone oxidoreductase subunit B [Acetobacter sp.]|nr:NADH-quinone oxidoreductase subunit B [Acetobacter sp.]
MWVIRAVLDNVFLRKRQSIKPAGQYWPIWFFHIDTGGCGGCGMELQALSYMPYDFHKEGFGFVTTPRAADILLVTGPVTHTMSPILEAVWEAMPKDQPSDFEEEEIRKPQFNFKGIIIVGECAINGGIFSENYAVIGGLEGKVPIDITIRGCPPTPIDILNGLRTLFERK